MFHSRIIRLVSNDSRSVYRHINDTSVTKDVKTIKNVGISFKIKKFRLVIKINKEFTKTYFLEWIKQ